MATPDDDKIGSENPAPAQPESVPDPVSGRGVALMGLCFLALAALVFYLFVASWPVPTGKPDGGFEAFHVFGLPECNWPPDRRLFLTVIMAGALGSLIHNLISFGDYVGNRRLSGSWIWWFILRTPIGVALALLFYLVLRGGLIVPTLPTTQGGATSATQLLNPHGIAAISALAGMFSKQATDKLREVFETMFTVQRPVPRADPLSPGKPGISKVEPDKLTKGEPEILTVSGAGFQQGCKATINGKARALDRISDTQVKVTTLPEDVDAVRDLELAIQNPNAEVFKRAIKVVEAGPIKPVISDVRPSKLTQRTAELLIVDGSGFQPKSTATINGQRRVLEWVSDTQVKVTTITEDVAAAGDLQLVIKSPDPNGASSDPRTIKVE